MHRKNIEPNKFLGLELVQQVFRKITDPDADFSYYTAFHKLHLRDEIYPVGKERRIVEVLCLKGRVILFLDTRANRVRHRITANCLYVKDRSYRHPAGFGLRACSLAGDFLSGCWTGP